MADTAKKAEKSATAERVEHRGIFGALSALQGELKSVPRTKEVKFQAGGSTVNFWYAPLDEIMEMLYPLLGKHGLSVRHELRDGGLECVLTHESSVEKFELTGRTKTSNTENVQPFRLEESEVHSQVVTNEIRSGVVKFKDSKDMKDLGGQITYARRYTLTLVLGIASEEDKDAGLLEARTEQLEKFAFKKAKEDIQKSTTVKKVEDFEVFFKKDLKALEDGKTPSLGLTKDQYEELLKLSDAKKVELNGGDVPPQGTE